MINMTTILQETQKDIAEFLDRSRTKIINDIDGSFSKRLIEKEDQKEILDDLELLLLDLEEKSSVYYEKSQEE